MPNFTTSIPKMIGLSGADEVQSLKPIDDAIMAMVDDGGGVVAVPGSADIDWAAIGAAPGRPANDTPFAGGRTFRFDDDLQGSAPVYFRINYGSGSTNVAALFIQVGTAVNADGTLAGSVSTRKVLSSGVAVNTPFTIMGSNAPNFFGFVFLGASVSSGSNMVIIIERMRDESGVETDDGFVLLSSGNGESSSAYKARVQPVPYVGAVPADSTADQHIPPIGNMVGLTSTGTDIVMIPIKVPHNGKWRYICALAYRLTDIAGNAVFDLQHMGDIRQFIALGPFSGRQWGWAGTPSACLTNLLMRWE